MTKEEIEAMPAGRELDTKVATIMGEMPPGFWRTARAYIANQEPPPPFYSTEIAAAFRIAEALIARGWRCDLGWWPASESINGRAGWEASFVRVNDIENIHFINAPTAPEAVVKAALLAQLSESPCPSPAP